MNVMKIMLSVLLMIWRNCIIRLSDVIPDVRVLNYFRWLIFKYILGMNVGNKCMFAGKLSLTTDAMVNLTIGDSNYFNRDIRIDCRGAKVNFGNKILIGPGCSFETGGHSTMLNEKNMRDHTSADILIEDSVWLGANVTVLQGITIGEGAVVAAGAVITKDVQKYSVVGGVPARIIKYIQSEGVDHE